GNPAEPGDDDQHPAEPVLRLRVQHRRHPDRGGRALSVPRTAAEPDDRGPRPGPPPAVGRVPRPPPPPPPRAPPGGARPRGGRGRRGGGGGGRGWGWGRGGRRGRGPGFAAWRSIRRTRRRQRAWAG